MRDTGLMHCYAGVEVLVSARTPWFLILYTTVHVAHVYTA